MQKESQTRGRSIKIEHFNKNLYRIERLKLGKKNLLKNSKNYVAVSQNGVRNSEHYTCSHKLNITERAGEISEPMLADSQMRCHGDDFRVRCVVILSYESRLKFQP